MPKIQTASVKRSPIQFLMIDLDNAFAFLNYALATENVETKERLRRKARKAYDAVARLAGRSALSGNDIGPVSVRLVRLKMALEIMGDEFTSTQGLASAALTESPS